MTVFANNEKYNLSENATLERLLGELKLKNVTGIALAVNNVVVPRSNWDSYKLKANDKIIVIKATQGG
ncbi:MAG: sulfur carrier protein ThiS [Cytophagales bacterium]|nr:sulfur carrier protein ThiS [Cytophagales bacterium]